MYEINENTEKLKGMRVKMTTTHGASGTSAPMCITVSGLDETELFMSDDELVKRRGMFLIKVQGLTVAGATNPLDAGFGCKIFTRICKGKECSADDDRVECYRQNTQLPFVMEVRKVVFPELKSGASLESHATAASWCDGDTCQIKAIKI